jgi:hypothetical protein
MSQKQAEAQETQPHSRTNSEQSLPNSEQSLPNSEQSRYVAAVGGLRFGDQVLEQGDPIPEEAGRDYDHMLKVGEIRLRGEGGGSAQGFSLTLTTKDGQVTLRPGEIQAEVQALVEENERLAAENEALKRQLSNATGEPLPADFPGLLALADAGIRTYEALPTTLEELDNIKGIGEATAAKILEALSARE